MRAAKAVVSLRIYTDSSEHLLLADANSIKISHADSNTQSTLYVYLASLLLDIGKQCRPRSDTA